MRLRERKNVFAGRKKKERFIAYRGEFSRGKRKYITEVNIRRKPEKNRLHGVVKMKSTKIP